MINMEKRVYNLEAVAHNTLDKAIREDMKIMGGIKVILL